MPTIRLHDFEANAHLMLRSHPADETVTLYLREPHRRREDRMVIHKPLLKAFALSILTHIEGMPVRSSFAGRVSTKREPQE